MDVLTIAASWLRAPDYWLSRWLFERALAAIYAIAYLVALDQFPALLGERGLLPAPRFLALTTFKETPSLFHLRYSDRLLRVVGWAGVAISVALLLGLPQRGPDWVPMLAWLALWVGYLSIVNVGQTFYAFGWESLLLEVGFLAVFLGSAAVAPPTLILLAIRWLLFRVEFGAGLIKLRGDRCWRELTCLFYHHETQPLPNPLSWYFHHLPGWVHRAEVAGNHVLQLVVPFGLLLPQPVAGAAGLLTVVHQGWLILSGNFSWLNAITITLAIAAFDDRQLGTVLPVQPPVVDDPPAWHTGLVLLVGAVVAVLSYWPVRNMLSPRQAMNASFNPFHLVNTYGAFGSITRVRLEVVLEGTEDAEPTVATVWREYEFKAKPGDPRRRPPQVAPYHLRLDWLMWFVPFSLPSVPRWLFALVERLLANDPAILRLLRRNPFPDEPPSYVRASLYRYRFTTPRERRATGAWWHRERVGTVLPPMKLAPGELGGWLDPIRFTY
ncbi:MAG TPA: lipase maturation factor family protein [Chloroflexota bacterium]|nr:lipase maturation factor family protein [Chloroflexota bacterium]